MISGSGRAAEVGSSGGSIDCSGRGGSALGLPRSQAVRPEEPLEPLVGKPAVAGAFAGPAVGEAGWPTESGTGCAGRGRAAGGTSTGSRNRSANSCSSDDIAGGAGVTCDAGDMRRDGIGGCAVAAIPARAGWGKPSEGESDEAEIGGVGAAGGPFPAVTLGSSAMILRIDASMSSMEGSPAFSLGCIPPPR